MMNQVNPFILGSMPLPDEEEGLDHVAMKLKTHKLVKFLGAYPSDEHRLQFMVNLAPKLEWKVGLKEGQAEFSYEEKHVDSVDAAMRDQRNSDDEVILSWHVEHIHNYYAQIGALWVMDYKSCAKESGSTGFVDLTNLHNILENDEKDFLLQCEIVQASFMDVNENDNIDILSSIQLDEDREYITLVHPVHKNIVPSYVRKPIIAHPQTGGNLLRVNPRGDLIDGEYIGHDRLIRFDGRPPTENEIKHFNKLQHWAASQIMSNPDIQHWHFWDEGDALLVDVLVMAHCVRGGFKQGQRHMKGIWAFPDVPGLGQDPYQRDKFRLWQVSNKR